MGTLVFGSLMLPCSEKSQQAPLPDLLGVGLTHSKPKYLLGEEDEIFQGYGAVNRAYPYRIYPEYRRALTPTRVRTAVLENEHMKAVFLPDYGGRLWQLTDLHTGRDLVYCNDVLRPANMGLRGPEVSGGVTWNLGPEGSPLAMDPVFAAQLEEPEGPVLRMYGYQRMGDLSYQMDFWLDPQQPGLNCHMAVFNQNEQVVPVSWWTRVTVPFCADGRVFLPSHRGFTEEYGEVHSVSVPENEGLDLSWYESLEEQRDYSLQLDRGAPRWMAHVASDGWGLLHSSTDRLQSRRLTVWGTNQGGKHWQSFLTEKAGPSLTLQAGLSPTAFGGIPMSPGTVWQWTERFEPIDLGADSENLRTQETVDAISSEYFPALALRIADQQGRKQLRYRGRTMIRGSGDAFLASAVRQAQGMTPLTPHLDIESSDETTAPWIRYVQTGEFPEQPGSKAPDYDLSGDFFREKLQKEVDQGRDGWYAAYELALLQIKQGRKDLAEQAIDRSLVLRETAWAWYVKAVLLLQTGGQPVACRNAVRRSMELNPEDLTHQKLCMQVLAKSGDWQELLDLELPEELRKDPRVRFWQAKALYILSRNREALDILEENGGLELPDIRLGDTEIGKIWQILKRRTTGKHHPIPYALDFDARDE